MENQDLWHSVLESLKVTVSPAIFSTWFAQTHLVSLKKDSNRSVAEVGCNSSFVKNTIEERYFGLVQELLIESLGTSCDLVLTVKQSPHLESTSIGDSSPLFDQHENLIDSEKISDLLRKVGLRANFTFKNFAVSGSNQMAWAAAQAIAKEPGTAYNPLFIWGGVGVGKTHLMSAVGHSLVEKDPDTNIIFSTGEQFTNDIVEGIRNKSTQLVRHKYRKTKVLFIDDIQFIAGKDAVQEEFFHTFNDLVANGSQIILTSDRPPSEISKLEERLRSRFEAGLIVDIAQPDFELRCAIIQIKSKEKGIDLAMDSVQLIAGNLEGARKIEGFLIRLISEARTKGVEITSELIETMLVKGENVSAQINKAAPEDYVSAVMKYYSIKKKLLLSTTRVRPVALPRQMLMYLLRTDLSLNLQTVGEVVGGRDHTTVMHAVDKITRLASTNVQIREDIRGIKQKL